MHCLEVRPKAQENVLKISIRNIHIAFSTLVVISRGSFVTTDQSSHASESRRTDQV